MSDLYSEHLVKKKNTGKDSAVKIGMIALTVIAAIFGILLNPLFFLAALGLGIADYLIFPTLNLEYEYLYVNGELDIDKIMSQTKRKKVKTFDVSKMEIMAPLKSHRMDYYNSNTRLKLQDYSSGDMSHKIYAMIIPDGQELCKVLLELDERMFSDIQKTSPRKVFND